MMTDFGWRKRSESTPSNLPSAPRLWWPRLVWCLRLAPRMPFVWLMYGYRICISPLYGDVCRYYPSCSKYALDAFEIYGAVRGTGMVVWRLMRCQPFSPGGVDHVPGSLLEKRQPRHRDTSDIHSIGYTSVGARGQNL